MAGTELQTSPAPSPGVAGTDFITVLPPSPGVAGTVDPTPGVDGTLCINGVIGAACGVIVPPPMLGVGEENPLGVAGTDVNTIFLVLKAAIGVMGCAAAGV